MSQAAAVRALALRPRIIAPQSRLRLQRIPFRNASATSDVATDARSLATRTKNLLLGSSIALALSFGYLYITDTRASFHQWLAVPALRAVYPDGEDAHHAGTAALKVLYSFGLHPRERGDFDKKGDLAVNVFGYTICNPIGTSAGVDKGAEVPTPLFAMGAGIVEIGAVTAMPQSGNPRPRVFRLPSQNALINRYGFNSDGAEHVAMRLRQRVREFAYHSGIGIDEEAERIVLEGEAGVPPGSLMPGRLMAVQIAKNKSTPETDIEAVVRDYTFCVEQLGRYADILVVNVSSPNTPGLRSLQQVEPLTRLLSGVVDAVKQVDRRHKPAIMVKVSPDEDSEEQVSGICEAVWDSGVDGIIVGNTTKKRPDPLPRGHAIPEKEARILMEQGGYSGPQMFERTLSLVKRYRKGLDEGPKQLPTSKDKPVLGSTSGDNIESSIIEKLEPAKKKAEDALSTLSAASPKTSSSETAPAPSLSSSRKVLFATGGITNGRQAREILDAGASVAQIYTALIYGGVGTITRIKEEMREEARKR